MKHIYYWFIFIFGLLIMSLGISLMITAHLGSAPWDVLNIGLFLNYGFSIGTWSIIVGFVIIVTTTILSRSFPAIGAILNMILVGIFIDQFLAMPWIETPSGFLGRLIMLIFGILINGIGIGIYISANRGAGPRDSLMLYLTKKTKWKLAHIRRLMEVSVLVLGWFLGGPVSIGTVLYSILIGTIIGWTLPVCIKIVKKMVERGVLVENLNKGTVRLNHNDGIS